MKKKVTKLALSRELTEILKESKITASERNLGYVSVSNILYHIFTRYIKSSQGTDQVLIDYFNTFRKTQLFSMHEITKCMLDSEKAHDLSRPKVFQNPDYIILDSEAENIFNVILDYVPDEEVNNIEIDTSIFLFTAFESGESDIEVLRELNIAGFNRNSDFVELVRKDKKLLNNLKNSKTDNGFGSKIISNPDEFFTGLLNMGSNKNTLKEKRIESPQQNIKEIIEQRNKDLREFEAAGQHEEISGTAPDPESTTPNLDKFSFDMTKADHNGKYDPVVGRENEINQIIKILCCRTKNNAVLLGDAGVGKTAVVESLVHKINAGDVPEKLKNKRICSLDLNALVSGTKYRGEYEARLQGIIKEVTSHPEVIVYIDEFHNLVGNGSTAGNGDGANILKPYLARGEFQCIGSTTSSEYHKFVEKDGALKRRFQNVQIDEPTEQQTIEILKKISKKYEEFHKVTYSPEILKICTEWAGRYITDRFFPDKAIDCIDRAGTAASLRTVINTDEIENLKAEIEDLVKNKIKSVEAQNFEEASKYYSAEEEKRKELAKVEKEFTKTRNNRKSWVEVTIDDVAAEISKISKVPIDKIRSTDRVKIRNMKKVFESKVIGQGEAVNKILTALQKNIMGFRDTSKPIASFLLCGETGTGKSYISKIVAQEFFGSINSLVRIDCGELADGKSSISKLTGATPGYVGYEDEPILEQIRRKPFSVLLVDEVDKVAPEAFNLFMNILDEGYCVLGNGDRVDFRNTIIIFTGNIGTKELQSNGKGLGFNPTTDSVAKHKEDEAIVMKSIKKFFRPEFINRLTGTIVFNSLTKENLKKIFTLEFNKVKSRIEKQGYQIKVTTELRNKIVDSCDTKYGARDLHRKIEEYITEQLSAAIINATDEDLENLKNITIDYVKGHVIVTFNHKLSTAKDKSEEVIKN
jgi:ATP-dependent Clp protease ATP-binding subunit ClpC